MYKKKTTSNLNKMFVLQTDHIVDWWQWQQQRQSRQSCIGFIAERRKLTHVEASPMTMIKTTSTVSTAVKSSAEAMTSVDVIVDKVPPDDTVAVTADSGSASKIETADGEILSSEVVKTKAEATSSSIETPTAVDDTIFEETTSAKASSAETTISTSIETSTAVDDTIFEETTSAKTSNADQTSADDWPALPTKHVVSRGQTGQGTSRMSYARVFGRKPQRSNQSLNRLQPSQHPRQFIPLPVETEIQKQHEQLMQIPPPPQLNFQQNQPQPRPLERQEPSILQQHISSPSQLNFEQLQQIDEQKSPSRVEQSRPLEHHDQPLQSPSASKESQHLEQPNQQTMTSAKAMTSRRKRRSKKSRRHKNKRSSTTSAAMVTAKSKSTSSTATATSTSTSTTVTTASTSATGSIVERSCMAFAREFLSSRHATASHVIRCDRTGETMFVSIHTRGPVLRLLRNYGSRMFCLVRDYFVCLMALYAMTTETAVVHGVELYVMFGGTIDAMTRLAKYIATVVETIVSAIIDDIDVPQRQLPTIDHNVFRGVVQKMGKLIKTVVRQELAGARRTDFAALRNAVDTIMHNAEIAMTVVDGVSEAITQLNRSSADESTRIAVSVMARTWFADCLRCRLHTVTRDDHHDTHTCKYTCVRSFYDFGNAHVDMLVRRSQAFMTKQLA